MPRHPPPLYWLLRLARRSTPRFVIDWMLDNEIFLRPGQDTKNPEGAASLYAEAAAQHEMTFEGRSILIVGFGGGYGVALELLERGASHITLHDPFARVRVSRNEQLPAERMSRFFQRKGDVWEPDPNWVSVVRDPMPEYASDNEASVDMVLSNSVLEHIRTEVVPANIAAFARVCRPGGVNIHHIDLRDHVFRYPFEMLCYSERTWQGWLNADNNLNRIRHAEFERQFRDQFTDVTMRTRLSLPEEFATSRDRIRSEFLTGNDEIDCIGAVVAVALR